MTGPQRPLLSVRALSKSFPGNKALDNVSLEVSEGEIVALVGHNGSGKSTLVKILAGVHSPDPGAEIALGAAEDGTAAEMHFIHQDLGLIGTLSTVENLSLSRRFGTAALLPAPVAQETRRAWELISGFGASFDVRRPVIKLTAAERTIVAIARAMDGWTQPGNILVLDEPTAALHGAEADKLFHAVRQVVSRGAGVIFISHRLDEVVELADRVVTLRDGRVLADVRRGEYDHDDLVELIAGGLSEVPAREVFPHGGHLALRARGLNGSTVRDLDLELAAGEVLGVSGVLGSGRDQIASILFGAGSGTVSKLEVADRAIGRLNPHTAISAGIAYVPADRHRYGLVMTHSGRENMTLPNLQPLRRFAGWLDQRAERREVNGWIGRLEVRPRNGERPMSAFSGGNQQKIVLAKWLRNAPKALLLDEPTQGVDVGAKVGIYTAIAEAASAGAGVLVCSSDDKELALICDRVLVMRDGRRVAEFQGERLTEMALVRAGLGTKTDPHMLSGGAV